MQQHPGYPDLLAADDALLADALGSGIAERETIHEWPLSWVQRIVLEDGRTLVYKSQLPPTVESEFYEQAASELLAGHRSLGRIGDCETMVIDWIEAPLLQELALGADDLLAHGHDVVAAIGQIAGDPPVYLDIGSPDKFSALVRFTVDTLDRLVGDGTFTSTSADQVERIRRRSQRPALADAITQDARLVHADLHDDQIFCTGDGYRIIDWQRPIIGPPELDLAALLINRGIDPTPYVSPTAVAAFWLHRLHWAVVAQAEIFPGPAWPLFDQWSSEAVRNLLALI
ncbi:MAG TPA: phosphotransferase [Mycobacteriales bacterium]|nr:phosphotransferase [Mycobacteriales bacterium]